MIRTAVGWFGVALLLAAIALGFMAYFVWMWTLAPASHGMVSAAGYIPRHFSYSSLSLTNGLALLGGLSTWSFFGPRS